MYWSRVTKSRRVDSTIFCESFSLVDFNVPMDTLLCILALVLENFRQMLQEKCKLKEMENHHIIFVSYNWLYTYSHEFVIK